MKRSSRKAITVLGACATLAACAAKGPNFARPATPKVGGYAMAGDKAPAGVALTPETRAAGPWWRDLGSSALDAVEAQALRDNPTGAEARADIESAEQQTRVALADRYPTLQGNAAAQRERINTAVFGFTGFPSPTITLLSIGATVSYAPDLFGLTRRRVEEARANAEAAARQADAAYLALTGNVALRAARIAALNAEIDALNAIVADDRASIAILRQAEAAGGSTRIAGLGGAAQLQSDLALAPSVEAQLAEARHELASYVGQPPSAWTAPNFSISDFHVPATIPVVVPSALVRSRPDILAAEADLHAATAQIGVAEANRYPNLNLVAGITQEALTPGSLFGFPATAYNFGPQLTAPLWHGGALKAQQRAAEAEARASLARYQQTVSTAFLQVSNVLAALAEDDRRIAIATTAQANAQASLDATRRAFQLGGEAWGNVIVAQRTLNRARLNLVDAQGLRLQDVIALYAATATRW